MFIKTTILFTAALVLGGCATQNTTPATPGKHLVYRDASGKVIRQFDYPSEDFCRRVEEIAGRSARCQPDSLDAQLGARATLRYTPPGVVIQAHYADMAQCRTDTGKLGTGVMVIDACAAR